MSNHDSFSTENNQKEENTTPIIVKSENHKTKSPVHNANTQQSKIELLPRLKGFLISYIIFSIPGFISGIVWIIISFLVLSIFAGLISGMNTDPDELLYNTLKEGKDEKSILVYNLNGAITSGSNTDSAIARQTEIQIKNVENDLFKLRKNKNIKNVVFKIDTPGGEASASQVLGDLIGKYREFLGQSESIFYFGDLVASGGLMATYKNPNYVVASPYGQTGSIGVILTLPNFTGIADKIGYKETVIKSSDNKDLGNPFREPSSKEIEYFQKQVDYQFSEFKSIVSTGRKLEPKEVDKIATGFTFFNNEAKELGLVDEIGELESAVKRASENANLGSDYKVIEIKNQPSFVDGLLGNASVAQYLGIATSASKVANKVSFFEPGRLYLIDETRF